MAKESCEIISQENAKDIDSEIILLENETKRKTPMIAINVTKPIPINIPQNLNRNAWLRLVDAHLDDDDDEEFVPPHVLVGQRLAGKVMAFSVCTGYGRTLKGRELSDVRNAILRMTGFLET